MGQNINSRGFLNLGSKLAVEVIACGARGVRNDQEATPWIGFSQSLESALLSLALNSNTHEPKKTCTIGQIEN